MEPAIYYPHELLEAVAKVEREGGRLLFIDKGHGIKSTMYTAYIGFIGNHVIAIVTLDMLGEGFPPITSTVYVSRISLEKAIQEAARLNGKEN